MTTHNPNNERIKRRYFTYLKEARRYSEASIDGVAKALHRFETDTKFRGFKSFHIEQAIAFKRRLRDQVNVSTGKPLSKATINSTLSALRNFFHWLADQPGFRKRIGYGDGDYFNLTEKEMRVAKAQREKPVPSIEQIHHVLETMSADTAIQKRNRALMAFTLLTGARDGALASFRIKHVNLMEGRVDQDAREVHTKFSKSFTTWFFPVGDDVTEIVESWIGFLTSDLLFGPDDPLFPATKVSLGEDRQFRADGLDRKNWSNAGPIRKVFREAFEAAGLPYFNPHSFRNTLAQLGERTCRTPEEFKAWSQNLGHEKVMTTFSSYGAVASARQADLIRAIGNEPGASADGLDLIEEALRAARLAREKI